MTRIRRSWQVEALAQPHKHAIEASRQIQSWVTHMKICTQPDVEWLTDEPPDHQALDMRGNQATPSYQQFIEKFQIDESLVYAQEDKDRAVFWAQDPDCYLARCLMLLLESPGTWAPVTLDETKYVTMLYKLHIHLLLCWK